MPCGHQCCAKCHPGPCKQVFTCAEIIKRRCKCRNLKSSEKCEGRFVGDSAKDLTLPCDASCAKLAEEKKLRSKENEIKNEENGNAADMETSGCDDKPEIRRRKKNRRRNMADDDDDNDNMAWYSSVLDKINWTKVMVALVFAIIFGTIIFILMEE